MASSSYWTCSTQRARISPRGGHWKESASPLFSHFAKFHVLTFPLYFSVLFYLTRHFRGGGGGCSIIMSSYVCWNIILRTNRLVRIESCELDSSAVEGFKLIQHVFQNVTAAQNYSVKYQLKRNRFHLGNVFMSPPTASWGTLVGEMKLLSSPPPIWPPTYTIS